MKDSEDVLLLPLRIAASDPRLTVPVDELEYASTRMVNCLHCHEVGFFDEHGEYSRYHAPIMTVGGLVTKTEAELLRMVNFGRKTLSEVKESLRCLHLSLGMEIVEEVDDELPVWNWDY